MVLDSTAREIYSRQIMMKEIGEAGQLKLSCASVLVIGCGGLGAPALYYLAAMGIGHIGLCDGDVVSLSNLNRQFLFTPDDLGAPKAPAAARRLLALNPRLTTTVYDCFFDSDLALEILPAYDIALDCLDNFEARFILNDASVTARKPFVHAGIGEFFGQLMTVTPGTGPCLRCLFPKGAQRPVLEQPLAEEKKEPNKPFGVVGPTPGVLGSLQALEALKYLLGLPVSNDGLTTYDGLQMTLEKIPLTPSPNCICRAS